MRLHHTLRFAFLSLLVLAAMATAQAPSTPLTPARADILRGEYSQWRANNDRMDILASIEGLKALKSKCRVKIYNNNLYLVEAMVKGWVQRWRENNWKTKENEKTANSDWWEQLLDLSAQHEAEFAWLKKDSNIKEFDGCDRLAHQAIKKS